MDSIVLIVQVWYKLNGIVYVISCDYVLGLDFIMI